MKSIASMALVFLLAAVTPANAEPPGKDVFNHYCVQCHGDSREATGTQQLARTRGRDNALLEQRDDLDAAYINYVVRHGLKAMPAFVPSDLNDTQLQALTGYLGR